MTKIPLEILRLEDESYHLLVEVVINSSIKGKMVLDTGASRTVIDTSLSLDIDCTKETPYTSGIGGQVDVSFTKLETLVIGAFRLENIALAMIDLSAVNSTYEQVSQQRILGLLGSDLLLKHHAKIDYKTATLYLA